MLRRRCLPLAVVLLSLTAAAPAGAGDDADVNPPAAYGPVPTPAQLGWQRRELAMFLHFGPNTFTGREWGDGTEAPASFAPTDLDARQWARVAREAGFGLLILTAKHHDGFCLWPTATTDHSVARSPWRGGRGGRGDVVRELADAARAEGLAVGVYLSPWDRNHPAYGDSPRYNDVYAAQLEELLTNYGPMAEVWFDGANGEGPNGRRQQYDWPRVWQTVRRLQPGAVIFSDAGPDVRWVGNEQGVAPDPCWARFDPAAVAEPGQGGGERLAALRHGHAGGAAWRPAEADVSIRPGWFWRASENERVRTPENLVDLYFKSVGRNSLLLLNVPPDTRGRLHEADVAALRGFRARLDEIFRTNLARATRASASNVRGGSARFAAGRAVDGDMGTYWATDDGQTTGMVELDLGRPTAVNVVSLAEAIELGQRVSRWRVEHHDGAQWRPLAAGETIGNRRLERFATVTTQRVRLVIEAAGACPAIAEIGLYRDPKAGG